MASPDPEFKNWSVPATKGDVLRALISMRGMTLQLWKASRALQADDPHGFAESIRKFEEAWDQSSELIESIGDGVY